MKKDKPESGSSAGSSASSALKFPLGERQEAFCQGMAQGLSARQAYLNAGFICQNPSSASVQASKLKKDFRVNKRIDELRAQKTATLAEEINAAYASLGARPEDGELGDLVGDVFTRVGRAKALAERRKKLLVVVKERAGSLEHNTVPGGLTGFVAVNYKSVGGEKIKTSEVDTGLLAELRATEQQIAREMGQWVERADETMTIKSVADLSDEMLEAMLKEAERFLPAEGEVVVEAVEESVQ